MDKQAVVLVCNCGSSSIKFALVRPHGGDQPLTGIAERLGSPEALIKWQLEGDEAGAATATQKHQQAIPGADHAAALTALLQILEQLPGLKPMAVGHRLVHGGERFTASALIDEQILSEVESCSHLAPLHNPANLLGVAAARAAFPALPQVGVFDTAFHQTMPPRAYRYPVPESWYAEHGVRRYGFHGTSHRFVAQAAADCLKRPLSETALITAHLGNGCSAAAIAGGVAVDTTMGLTPLEGLVMGTRSGDVDPGLFAYMAKRLNTDVEAITNILNKESGLLGLSAGLASDMRQLVSASEEGHQGAQLALDVFAYRLAKSLAGLAVALGRLDAVVFTGGIGENSAPVRAMVLDHLHILGLSVDPQRNQCHGRQSAGRISPDQPCLALVVPTNEELQIARETIEIVEAQ